MTRIDDIFKALRADGRAALMPYMTAGYPSLDSAPSTILAMEEAGASIVEVGIPFSDPIADGPVIAQAMHDALEQGVTPPAIFECMASIRKKTNLGLLAMVSDSIITRIGPDRFIADAAASGFDGLIIPDIDTATAAPIADLVQKHNMILSVLIAPTSSAKRIESLLRLCTGFMYLLARAGITGERNEAPDIRDQLTLLRGMSDLPIAVGFGISTRDHVAAVTGPGGADAAIVGSAVVRAMGEAARNGKSPSEAAANLVRKLATGLRTRQPV